MRYRSRIDHRNIPSRWCLTLGLLVASSLVTWNPACAQDDSAAALAERSAIVLRGKVVKTYASAEPTLAASKQTAVVMVLETLAGQEIVGEQNGKTATVVLHSPDRLKVGDEALFFGNPRFMGQSLTLADEGEILAAPGAAAPVDDARRGIQARRDRPVRERLEVAALVFRGTVESVRPLAAAAGPGNKPEPAGSEHDPEWQVAMVRVASPLRGGKAGDQVAVIFAASRDIVWFAAPKLSQGQDAIFVAHAADKEEGGRDRSAALATFLAQQTAYLVTKPSDVLAPTEEARVRGLLAQAKENKP